MKPSQTELIRFVAIIVAVILLLLSLVTWFDYIDELDTKLRECAERGGQSVKFYGQTEYTCIHIKQSAR